DRPKRQPDVGRRGLRGNRLFASQHATLAPSLADAGAPFTIASVENAQPGAHPSPHHMQQVVALLRGRYKTRALAQCITHEQAELAAGLDQVAILWCHGGAGGRGEGGAEGWSTAGSPP